MTMRALLLAALIAACTDDSGSPDDCVAGDLTCTSVEGKADGTLPPDRLRLRVQRPDSRDVHRE
jgi:hypothetical protein